MAHSLDGNTPRAGEVEVGRLVDELIAEIGSTRPRPEIVGLALKLQALIDEKEAKAGRRIFS